MALSTGAAILGSSVIGGLGSVIGANSAADAQADASNASIAEQRRQFDTMLGLTSPQRNVGNQALNTLASAFIPGYSGMNVPLYGPEYQQAADSAYQNWLAQGNGQQAGPRRGQTKPRMWAGIQGGGGQTSRQQFDRLVSQGQITIPGQQMNPIGANQLSEQFNNLPGTQFMLNEMTKNIGNSFAARGGALGGNALRALADRTSNFAADRIFGQLNTLAGYGNQASSQAAQGALNTGANIGNTLYQQGSDRASGILAGYGGVGQAVNGGLSNWLMLQQRGG